MKMLKRIKTPQDLIDAVHLYGFLPFFSTPISGFSIDEMVPISVWETNYGLGPWMWRDEIAETKEAVYGKFFHGKTGYIAAEWLAHFANYRRNGYDCDAAYEDGLMRYSDKKLFDILADHGSLSAPELKKKAGVESKKTSAFDSAIMRLQMKAYIVPCSFYFPVDEDGNKKYSYGVTSYDLPERWLSEDVVRGAYNVQPQESFEMIVEHLNRVLQVKDSDIIRDFLK